VHLADVPYPLLRQQGQGPLLTMLPHTVKTQAIKRLVDTCDTRDREGLVTNVHKGEVPSRSQRLATSLAKDVVRPPLSLRRIDRYEGHRVPSHDRSPQSERVERDTVAVYPCIGRMLQHVFPNGFQRSRSDGVQATKTFAQLQDVMQEALAQVKGLIKGASKLLAPLP
jgi:hypothetical protein